MKNLKLKIKEILPNHIVYGYLLIKKVPRYIKSLWNTRNDTYPEIHYYSDIETVDKIVNEGKSLSRFGDGEISWICGVKLDSYQEYSEEFSRELKIAFQSNNDDLLIGIPYGLVDSSKCNYYAKMHWKIFKSDFFWKMAEFADLTKVYSNTNITRPYIDYRDRKFSEKSFKNLKRIWDKKEVVFVEGEKTKLGIGNDLFSNAKKIKRIICPAKDAYSKLNEIEETIMKFVDTSVLILTALGPTASILASHMCDKGYQIVDIGHIDIEYIWFLNHAILRDEVPGKYVNESGKKDCSGIYDTDKEYLDSILYKII